MQYKIWYFQRRIIIRSVSHKKNTVRVFYNSYSKIKFDKNELLKKIITSVIGIGLSPIGNNFKDRKIDCD